MSDPPIEPAPPAEATTRTEPAAAPEPAPSAGAKAPPPKGPARRSWWLIAIVALFVSGIVTHAILVRFLVDRFWLATVLAYLPRWVAVLPLPIVVALLTWKRDWKLALPVAGALVLQLFWAAGLRISLLCPGRTPERSLRIVTQNSMRKPFDDGWLDALVKAESPDLVVVQECAIVSSAERGPSPLPGYNWATDANTCLFSKWRITKEDPRDRHDVWDRGGSGAIALYAIEAPFGTAYVLTVHFMTARDGLEGIHKYKLGGIAAMKENTEARRYESTVAREWSKRTEGPLIVAGDFNMPVESAIFESVWGDLESAFDKCGSGFGYSKETVVKGIEYGVRIDHVLYDARWTCNAAHLAASVGSDHRAMVADLSLKP
ncbi:MAG: hypothetical protein U0414_40865 [Polyangiaceae bacterium]